LSEPARILAQMFSEAYRSDTEKPPSRPTMPARRVRRFGGRKVSGDFLGTRS